MILNGIKRDDGAVHTRDEGLGPGQEILRDEITAHVTAEADRSIGAVNAHTTAETERTTAPLATALELMALRGTVDEIKARQIIDGDATTIALADLSAGLAAVREQQTADHVAVMSAFTALGAALSAVMDEVAKQGQTQAAMAKQATVIASDVAWIRDFLEPDTPTGTWQDQWNLIDPNFLPVLGIHTGGDGKGASDPELIAGRMGQRIQAAPIYWKKDGDPTDALKRKLKAGTVARLELCFPHIVTGLGYSMDDGSGKSFWGRVPDGGYDEIMVRHLQKIAAFMDENDQAILLSVGHESDLTVEDGSSPKVEGREPTKEERCGDWSEYPAYHAHLAALVRQHAPRARIFLNFSGGYEGAPKKWSQMLPPAGTFDFFGYDFYSQYGKTSDKWESFEERLKLFGRWAWYLENLPDVPMIIGETGVCSHKNPTEERNAGRWYLDAIDFTVANRWRGVGTGGGISQVHIFSHHYSAHPRCIDDNGTHPGCDSGQVWAVLPQIGADTRLAWA